MPELPEVETIRRQLAPRLVGRRIEAGWAFDSAKFDSAPDAVGARIIDLRRRGKYLLADLEDGRRLVVHLGMTGSLRIAEGLEPDVDPYVRAWWDLDSEGRLVFRDVRRFGRVAVLDPDDETTLPTLAALGPEPFDDALTPERFRKGLNTGRRHLKTKVLDQRLLAGVGNIYADEAFFAAGVHPADRRVSATRAGLLLEAIRSALTDGIEHGGTTLRDYVDGEGRSGSHQSALRCYGRSGQPCDDCGSILRRRVIDARSTTWCPTCQPRRT